MKQALLHLFGLSHNDKIRKHEAKRQKEIDDRNARIEARKQQVSEFDAKCKKHKEECAKEEAKGYSSSALPKIDFNLALKELDYPVFSRDSAANAFARFLEADDIKAEDVSLVGISSLENFSGCFKLVWFYNNYYITVELSPEFGYVCSEASKLYLAIRESRLNIEYKFYSSDTKKLCLDIEIKDSQLIAKKIYVKCSYLTFPKDLRSYPADISEEELIADCIKFVSKFNAGEI